MSQNAFADLEIRISERHQGYPVELTLNHKYTLPLKILRETISLPFSCHRGGVAAELETEAEGLA